MSEPRCIDLKSVENRRILTFLVDRDNDVLKKLENLKKNFLSTPGIYKFQYSTNVDSFTITLEYNYQVVRGVWIYQQIMQSNFN